MVFSTKVNLLYLPLFNGSKISPVGSNKAKFFAEIFSTIIDLDDQGISLPKVYLFLSRTNLKLFNVLVTPKLLKKVIADLDSSKVPGLNFEEPEPSYLLSNLVNMWLKESCFPDY